jgi:hypothetical protein
MNDRNEALTCRIPGIVQAWREDRSRNWRIGRESTPFAF